MYKHCLIILLKQQGGFVKDQDFFSILPSKFLFLMKAGKDAIIFGIDTTPSVESKNS